ncbi:MAG TPA: SGNH/GDSL hydrolase family protein [Allosphingosinicella sp.]|jgi:lysophospholipase L1-like esterase
MPHIILLGDSIFDNGAYVRGGPDVVRQLQAKLPDGWRATLAAVDGATTRDVAAQLRHVPADATHLIVSAGGNDALGTSHVLHEGVGRVGEALAILADAADRFAASYVAMLDAVLARGLPIALCTVYDTPQTSGEARIIRAALTLFNDVITRAAFSRGLALVDLRLICSDPGDYANPIEPSVAGGDKISAAILAAAQGRGASRVVAG